MNAYQKVFEDTAKATIARHLAIVYRSCIEQNDGEGSIIGLFTL